MCRATLVVQAMRRWRAACSGQPRTGDSAEAGRLLTQTQKQLIHGESGSWHTVCRQGGNAMARERWHP